MRIMKYKILKFYIVNQYVIGSALCGFILILFFFWSLGFIVINNLSKFMYY